MKVISIALAGVSLALIALTLVPSAGDYRPYLAAGALVCALIVLVTILVGWRDQPAGVATQVVRTSPAAPDLEAERTPASAPTIVSRSTAANDVRVDATRTGEAGPSPAAAKVDALIGARTTAEADVVGFLAVLQEKGRLVDFLQDDITSYSDAQVGAAARVVHQGCKSVLHDYFRIVPVRQENEGAKVTLAPGYTAGEYRLVGKISGQAPFSGTLMHRGWKAETVNLPRLLNAGDDRLPVIAPAEVELR